MSTHRLTIFSFLGILGLTACAAPLQPIALFYIEDGRGAEAQLRSIAQKLAQKHGMYHREFESRYGEDVHTIFGATSNGLLYRLSLRKGTEPEFSVTFLQQRVLVSIAAPPNHFAARTLIAEWSSALDAAGVLYKKETR